jgi:hypothetical protein
MKVKQILRKKPLLERIPWYVGLAIWCTALLLVRIYMGAPND